MPEEADANLSGLLHLLKASSKKTVAELCNLAASTLVDVTDSSLTQQVQAALDLKETEALQLSQALRALLRAAVYHGSQDEDSVKKLFPTDFHANLRSLLTKVIIDNSEKWKTTALANQISMPRLVKLDWEVKSNEATNRQPSCLLHLTTTEHRSVNVELSKASLDTMLDSLSKIQEQISSVNQ